MENRSYLNQQTDLGEPDVVVNAKVLPDGRRAKENVTKIDNGDGTKEYTHEILEEVIPMRVSERIRCKTKEIPIEETREIINENGIVETSVKNIDPQLLDLGRRPTTLEEVAKELRSLREEISQAKRSCVSITPDTATPPASFKDNEKLNVFLQRAAEKWGARQKDQLQQPSAGVCVKNLSREAEVSDEVPSDQPNTLKYMGLAALAWMALAIVAGLATYSILG